VYHFFRYSLSCVSSIFNTSRVLTCLCNEKRCYLLFLFCLATQIGQAGSLQHWSSGMLYGHFSSLFMFLVTSVVPDHNI
jgi:hypothetical protein